MHRDMFLTQKNNWVEIRFVFLDRRVLGRKMLFWRGKNHDFEPKGVDLYPPRGATMGSGREWNANDSCNHSRKYSRELWEVTSLVEGVIARSVGTARSVEDETRNGDRNANQNQETTVLWLCSNFQVKRDLEQQLHGSD